MNQTIDIGQVLTTANATAVEWLYQPVTVSLSPPYIFKAMRDAEAAARVAKYYLPSAKLSALAKKYSPPQSWYTDETDPFN